MDAPTAAEFMGVGERQLRDGLRAGRVPHLRLGDRYVINRYGLRAHMEEMGRLIARGGCTSGCTPDERFDQLGRVYQRPLDDIPPMQRTARGAQRRGG